MGRAVVLTENPRASAEILPLQLSYARYSSRTHDPGGISVPGITVFDLSSHTCTLGSALAHSSRTRTNSPFSISMRVGSAIAAAVLLDGAMIRRVT